MTQHCYRGIVTAVEAAGVTWQVTMRLLDYDMMQFTFFWLPERGAPPKAGDKAVYQDGDGDMVEKRLDKELSGFE